MGRRCTTGGTIIALAVVALIGGVACGNEKARLSGIEVHGGGPWPPGAAYGPYDPHPPGPVVATSLAGLRTALAAAFGAPALCDAVCWGHLDDRAPFLDVAYYVARNFCGSVDPVEVTLSGSTVTIDAVIGFCNPTAHGIGVAYQANLYQLVRIPRSELAGTGPLTIEVMTSGEASDPASPVIGTTTITRGPGW
jgi:hypothetical protein